MKKFKVGLQLYSVRGEMEKDMEKTLKAVKEMGYDYVEFAGYFDKSADEIKALLDKYGLEAVSVHQVPSFYWEKGQEAVDFVKTLGVKYSVIPWYDAEALKADWECTTKKFAELGKLLKENGIQLGYHNHDFEFQPYDGGLLIDKLYEAVPSEYLVPQFDTCWVKYANYCPVEYINKYSGQVGILHLKDFVASKFAAGAVYGLIDENGNNNTNDKKDEPEFMYKPLGQGVQDFKAILEAAEKAGTEYVIVEQDDWYDGDALEIAKTSREYLKNTFDI